MSDKKQKQTSPDLETPPAGTDDTATEREKLLDRYWDALVDGNAPGSGGSPDPVLRNDLVLLERLNSRNELSGQFAPVPESQTGDQLGDYKLLEQIGRGGMGVVFRAHQTSLNREVAIKMLRSGFLATDEELERFRREAESTARLNHPNIVSLFEVGQHDQTLFFSMELIRGCSLGELVRQNALPAKRAAGYLEKIARAVHYAHQQGVIHRDLKPSNILIDENDQPRLTDFGLARILATPVEPPQDLKAITATGAAIGTPAYMSPEQAAGVKDVSGPACDVYSLGAVLYELITGRAPFRTDSPLETLRQVVDSEPAAPRVLNDRIPIDLETICLKCLVKEPGQRYSTAEQLAEDLRRFQSDQPVLARPVGRAAALWRWCRRNPVIAGSIGMSLGLLLAFAIGSTIVATRLQVAEKRARDDREAAVSAFTELVQDLYNDLGRRKDTIREREAIINTAIRGLKNIAERSEGGEADRNLSLAHARMGDLYALKGDLVNAESQYQESIRAAEEVIAQRPKDSSALQTLAESNRALAAFFLQHSHQEKAEPCLQKAKRILKELTEAEPSSAVLLGAYVKTLQLEINQHDLTNDVAGILDKADVYAASADRLSDLQPDDPDTQLLASGIYTRLGRLFFRAQQFEPAAQNAQKARTCTQTVVDIDSENDQAATLLLNAIRLSGLIKMAVGKPTEAASDLRLVVNQAMVIAEQNPDDVSRKMNVASAHLALSYTLHTGGEYAESETAGLSARNVYLTILENSGNSASAQAGLLESTVRVFLYPIQLREDWEASAQLLSEALGKTESNDGSNAVVVYRTQVQRATEPVLRHLGRFEGEATDYGTTSLLQWYCWLDIHRGNNDLTPESTQKLKEICGLEVATVREALDAIQELKTDDQTKVTSHAIDASIHGELAHRAKKNGDVAARKRHLATALDRIRLIHESMPTAMKYLVGLEAELDWVRTTSEFKELTSAWAAE